MPKTNDKIKLLLNISRANSILAKYFDRGAGNGLGFNEFLILFYLDEAPAGKMIRIDLAEKIGLTASGITRLLLPMEKIHLIKSGPAVADARVRPVMLTSAGKEKMLEALERLDYLAEEGFNSIKAKDIKICSDLLTELGGRILMS